MKNRSRNTWLVAQPLYFSDNHLEKISGVVPFYRRNLL